MADAPQKTSTTRLRQKQKNRVDDALRVVFGTPRGAPKNASRSPISVGNSEFFATKKMYLKHDALRKPNLEPDVGEPTGSAAYDATRVAKAGAGT